MLLSLGGYHFSLDSAAYQSKERTTLYRWNQLDRLQRDPAPPVRRSGRGHPEPSGSNLPPPQGRPGAGREDARRGREGPAPDAGAGRRRHPGTLGHRGDHGYRIALLPRRSAAQGGIFAAAEALRPRRKRKPVLILFSLSFCPCRSDKEVLCRASRHSRLRSQSRA